MESVRMQREECLACLREQKLNCAETVLSALDKQYDLQLTVEERKVISAFGGGTCAGVCGALCGALAALGKFHVHDCAHKSDGFVDSCRKFVEFFQENMGDLKCDSLYERFATEEEGCLETVIRTVDLFEEYRKEEEHARMKVVIVGGVAGGASTAARLRRNSESAEIVLLEKGEFISFANCGLPYYIGEVITDKSELQLQTPESFYNRFRVDVRLKSEVIAVDPKRKWVTVKDLETEDVYHERYDKLVLSPGAHPINPFSGVKGSERVFTLRNIPDTYAIRQYVKEKKPKTCTIIGAGFIGLEVAENLTALGMTVTVVEAAPHVMAPLDLDVAHEVHNYLREKGVELCLGKKCTEINEENVLLDDGTQIHADMVVLSIGVLPDTAFLRDSGIALGRRGEILVSKKLETSISDIYAVGDAIAVENLVTGVEGNIPLAGPANKQGRIVADVLCGIDSIYEGSLGTAVMKLFDMTVAAVGAKEEVLAAMDIPYRKSFTYSSSHAGYYPGGTMMLIKLLFSPDGGQILGAQIVGYEGVDKRIDSISNAIRFGLSIYDLQKMDLAYAPPFSSAKDPVNMAGYVAGNILEGKMIPYYVEDIDRIPKNAVCIDVRTEEEYQAGTIPGFTNIPVDALRERLEELDPGKEIYLTCQIGLRGYIAQRILEGHGYKTHNLAGGYRRYQATISDC